MRGPAAALALALATAACGGGGDPGGLPPVEGRASPEAYRIVYEVTTPEGTSREEHVVRRPFEAQVTVRDRDGEVTSQRSSAFGLLVTEAQGQAVAVETAIAPAAADLRPERFADRLVEAERLERGDEGEVGGRPCRRLTQPDVIVTEGPAAEGSDGAPEQGTFPVRVSRCVDALGLVLEERTTTPGGRTIRTKRAVELEVGSGVPTIAVPDVGPLPPAQGGGEVEEQPGPRPEGAWTLRAPAGFEPVGRYAVRPATLGARGPGGITMVTEVWQRGPDVLLLDQGSASDGVTPFDPDSAVGSVELEGIGPATLAVELRSAEVRLADGAGSFVRLAGTLPLDELIAVARTLRPGP